MNQPRLSFVALVSIVFGLIVVPALRAGEAMIKPEAVPAYQSEHFPFENGEGNLPGDLERHGFRCHG